MLHVSNLQNNLQNDHKILMFYLLILIPLSSLTSGLCNSQYLYVSVYVSDLKFVVKEETLCVSM